MFKDRTWNHQVSRPKDVGDRQLGARLLCLRGTVARMSSDRLRSRPPERVSYISATCRTICLHIEQEYRPTEQWWLEIR